MSSDKLTCDAIRKYKGREPLAALTAYDFPLARLLDEAEIPLILVGDSLGMVVLGFPDTTHVTMDHMIHHVGAVARAQPRALIGGDLPHHSYETAEQAVANARRLLEAGADFVKAEGGTEILPVIQAIQAAGIPFCGHLGMLPQHVLEEGGKYRIKGRDEAGRRQLLKDAAALERAGVFACVLELVTPPVAAEITQSCSRMVTIGIGSGPNCDGQILVTPDLIGAFPWFTPRFVTPLVQTGQEIRQAVSEWKQSLGAAQPLRPSPSPQLVHSAAVAYALIQRTMTRPSVEALERAFASGRALTPADARFVADDAFGLLSRNLELEDALFLQQSLGAEGIEVEVVPESDLPRAPDAQLFSYLKCADGKITLFDALDRTFEAPCEAVTVICAGYDQREFKLEILISPDSERFSATLERLMFDRMPRFADPSEPDNVGEKYRNLVRCLVNSCPRALTNRAAAVLAQEGLTGDVTAAITYPRPTAYAEEQTWLLWQVHSGSSE